MKPTLYWMSGSPFAWRVQVACAIKEIEHTSERLSFPRGDTKTPAFRALNPRGQVPVLVHGDMVLTESLAILRYLDLASSKRPLFGATPDELAKTWQTLLDLDGHFVADARTVARACFRDQVDARLDELQPIVARLDEEMTHLAGHLNADLDAVTAVDVVVYPSLMQLLRAYDKPSAAKLERRSDRLRERFGALLAWRDDFAALPGIDATYPPHWRDEDG